MVLAIGDTGLSDELEDSIRENALQPAKASGDAG
jgi:hypothetical protein